MSRKKFAYRGLSIEELQAKSLEEIAMLMPARVRRSIKKGFSDSQKNLLVRIRKARKLMEEGKKIKPIRTQSRNMPILPEMVDMEFAIYNGKEFQITMITADMLGCYLGDFAITVKPVKHSAPGVGATRSSLFVPLK